MDCLRAITDNNQAVQRSVLETLYGVSFEDTLAPPDNNFKPLELLDTMMSHVVNTLRTYTQSAASASAPVRREIDRVTPRNQIVFDKHEKKWIVTSKKVPTFQQTHKLQAQSVEKAIERTRTIDQVEMENITLQIIQERAKPEPNVDKLCSLYDNLTCLSQSSAYRLGRSIEKSLALNRQVLLSCLLHVEASSTAILAALCGGDVTMLALQDLSEVSYTSEQRLLVSNIFAALKCTGNVEKDMAVFRAAVENEPRLGEAVLKDLQRVGLAL